MDFLYAIFFGAGVAAYMYTKLGRRVGYGNTGNVYTVIGAVFVITTLFFFTILKFIIHV
ncbi:MAG: hypothetical protein AAB436_01030 [Patescibacteria group bacterium]